MKFQDKRSPGKEASFVLVLCTGGSSKADALADTHMPTAEELEKMDYTAQLRSIEKLVTNRNVRKVSTNVRRPSSLGAHSTVRGYQAPSHVGRVADDYVA